MIGGLINDLLSIVGLGSKPKRRRRRRSMGIMHHRQGGGYTRFGRYMAYGGARGPWRGYRGHVNIAHRRYRSARGRYSAFRSRMRSRRWR